MQNTGMDENKLRRRWLSFGIRDLLWAMAVVALMLGWWVARRSTHAQVGRYQLFKEKEGVTIMLDTATGRQWVRYNSTGEWHEHTSPQEFNG